MIALKNNVFLTVLSIVVLCSMITGCSDTNPKNKAVVLLIDTSGTYTKEIEKAQAIMNYLLATLESGDAMAIAKIDSGSFSQKDIIAKATFDSRPSTANGQKRLFKQQVDEFVSNLSQGSANTDITGGLIQAAEFLNETGAQEKRVMIFSDLEEDLPEGFIRDFELQVNDIHVTALNVTKLRSDNVDPREYQKRVSHWRSRIEDGGGQWQVINDLENLEKIL